MDRIYLAIIASALLLLLGATGLYVTRTADLMPHARTVGFSGSRWRLRRFAALARTGPYAAHSAAVALYVAITTDAPGTNRASRV